MKPLTIAFCALVGMLAVGCQERTNRAVGGKDAIVDSQSPASGESTRQERPVVIAYYFHRTLRCAGCLAIEARAAAAIEKYFAEQLADGRLVWMPFNVDEPGGEDYQKEFDLSFNSLVLSKTQDGRSIEHAKLDNVWSLAGNPVQFDDYVKNEVRRFLNE
ncbi:MAG: hypothetical protein IH624_11080 [Phycisphaerae bacterium]|nr:hypothetical protein [Phycisphaerae bacterium]